LIDPDAAWLRLTYTASGNPLDYRVGLVANNRLMAAAGGGFCAHWRARMADRRGAWLSSTCRPAANISEAAKLMGSPNRHAKRAANTTGSFVVSPLRFEQTRQRRKVSVAVARSRPSPVR
jgi:hypothetical protein